MKHARLAGSLLMLALALCAPVGGASANGLGAEWTYQYALSTSDRGADLGYLTSSFERQAWLREPAMLDLLAEALLRGVERLDYSQSELSRMASVILSIDSPRYLWTMNAVSANAAEVRGFRRDDRAHRIALAEIAHKYIEKHGATHAAQYRSGTISLDAMRARYEAPRLGFRPTTALGQKLLTIRVGEGGATFDDVIGALGTPQHIGIGTAVMVDGGFRAGGIRWTTHTSLRYRDTDRLHYFYRGVGRVTFRYRHATQWRAVEVIADPMLFEREMPYRAEAATNGQPDEMTLRIHELLYGGYRSVRQAVELWAPVSFTPEVKDAAAEFLVANYVPDRGEIIDDTFVVLCRFLVQSDPARYGALVQDIAARSGDRRIRKLARSIDSTGADPARRFQPGAVSLEALRRKYPPLYPASTFIGPETDAKEMDEPVAD